MLPRKVQTMRAMRPEKADYISQWPIYNMLCILLSLIREKMKKDWQINSLGVIPIKSSSRLSKMRGLKGHKCLPLSWIVDSTPLTKTFHNLSPLTRKSHLVPQKNLIVN